MKHLALLLLFTFAMSPCLADVPVTGRHQDMTFPASEVNAYAAVAYHRLIAEQRRAGLIDTDPALVARVRRIAAPIIAEAGRLKYQSSLWHWEIHVSNDPEVNASSMAGGKLLIGRGFIAHYRLTDGELAAVLAHEIAHAVAEHVREQLSEVQLRNPRYSYSVEDAAAAMGSDMGLYLSLMPLSELQESEADQVGVDLLAAAGYPPRAALSFYRKLAAYDADADSGGLFNTHGSDQGRLQAVTEFVERMEQSRSAAVQ
jgi:predicted Zn-dependent protease